MLKLRKTLYLPLAAAFWLAGCGTDVAAFDVEAHKQEVLEWRTGRLERLMAPTGYLTLAGLYWLSPGNYSFGSGSDNDVVFPQKAPSILGKFVVTADGIQMQVSPDSGVLVNDLPANSVALAADVTGEPDVVRLGTLEWMAIQREDKHAIRLRDTAHPAREQFGELPYYDIDPNYRVIATLKRYAEPRIAKVGTVVEGLGYNPESPGVVQFELDGVMHELEAYASGEDLFFVFGDLTNRDATYGAGRFLYSAVPGEDGKTVLDFNKAYSPPCAFNDFATCPVASPRNRLQVAVLAGEKFDEALHYDAGH